MFQLIKIIAVCSFVNVYAAPDSAKVLPQSINRVTFESETVSFNHKFNSESKRNSLAEPFEKKLSAFDLSNLRPAEVVGLKAMLEHQGINSDLGSFDASSNFNVQVFKAGYERGITNNLSIGFALSVWDASSDINVTFNASESGLDFVKSSAFLSVEDRAKLLKIYENGSNAVNDKLNSQGMDSIGHWSERGLGDTRIGAKYSFDPLGHYRTSLSFTTMIPTGRKDDPNNIQDVAFSEETFVPELYSVHAFEWERFEASFSGYGRYPIAYETTMRVSDGTGTYFDSYNKSVLVRPGAGVGVKTGFSILTFDQVSVNSSYGVDWAGKTKYSYNNVVNKEGSSQSQLAMMGLGYSTIPHYRNKKFFLPAEFSLDYKTTIQGRNSYDTKALVFNTKVYF